MVAGLSGARSCAVVGVGPGLGLALATRFARAAMPVGLIGRDQASLDGYAQGLRDEGHRAVAVAAEAGDPAALTRAIAGVREAAGPIGILIFNAAVYPPGVPSALAADVLAGAFAVNATAPLVAVQAALPDMRAAGAGTILLTGGGAALYPSVQTAALSVTKAALRTLAFCLHDELTPEGIHATTVTIEGGIGSRPAFAPERIAERYWAIRELPPAEWRPEHEYTG